MRRGAAVVERALPIDESTYGPDHPTVAIQLSGLAIVLKNLGMRRGAAVVGAGVADQWVDLWPGSSDGASDLSNMAIVLQDLGMRPRRCRCWSGRCGSMSHDGPDHPHVAIRLSNLATVLQDLGCGGGAPLLERALRIDESTYGPIIRGGERSEQSGDRVAGSGGCGGARPLLERRWIDESTYGPDHPHVASDLSNLAMVLQDLADVAGRGRCWSGRCGSMRRCTAPTIGQLNSSAQISRVSDRLTPGWRDRLVVAKRGLGDRRPR